MNTIAPISDAAERAKVLEACREFVAARPSQTFGPGRAYVPVTGKVPDATDLLRLVDASLDLLLTAGGSRNCSRQPRELCRYQTACTRQLAFRAIDFRVCGTLAAADKIMNGSFRIGVWPRIGPQERSAT